MTYPTQPSYGLIEKSHLKVDQIARDVEAMATAMLRPQARKVDVVFATGAYTIDPANGELFVCGTTPGQNATLTLGGTPVAGDAVEVIVPGTYAYTVSVTDAVGAITFTASKKGSVMLRYTGSAWMRVGTHYQET